jgi:hypothetical protein
MRTTRLRRRHRHALALATSALAGLALATTAIATNAQPPKQSPTQRLVVRGDATIIDHPCAPDDCNFEYAGGTFRGTLGAGSYTGSFDFDPASIFPNGEGGVCAPIRGTIVLGAGSPDRLVLALRGDSCQDGAGNPTTSSFTTAARFTIEHGTGKYANTTGGGILNSTEDATDHDGLTLIGRISR